MTALRPFPDRKSAAPEVTLVAASGGWPERFPARVVGPSWRCGLFEESNDRERGQASAADRAGERRRRREYPQWALLSARLKRSGPSRISAASQIGITTSSFNLLVSELDRLRSAREVGRVPPLYRRAANGSNMNASGCPCGRLRGFAATGDQNGPSTADGFLAHGPVCLRHGCDGRFLRGRAWLFGD